MDAIHGFAIDLHEGVGVLVEGNHPRLEAEPLAFADRPLVTVANVFPEAGLIERQVHGHGFRRGGEIVRGRLPRPKRPRFPPAAAHRRAGNTPGGGKNRGSSARGWPATRVRRRSGADVPSRIFRPHGGKHGGVAEVGVTVGQGAAELFVKNVDLAALRGAERAVVIRPVLQMHGAGKSGQSAGLRVAAVDGPSVVKADLSFFSVIRTTRTSLPASRNFSSSSARSVWLKKRTSWVPSQRWLPAMMTSGLRSSATACSGYVARAWSSFFCSETNSLLRWPSPRPSRAAFSP